MIKKCIRILWIHEELHQKHFIKIDDLTKYFHSSSKTIRHDIDDLRTYYTEKTARKRGMNRLYLTEMPRYIV